MWTLFHSRSKHRLIPARLFPAGEWKIDANLMRKSPNEEQLKVKNLRVVQERCDFYIHMRIIYCYTRKTDFHTQRLECGDVVHKLSL